MSWASLISNPFTGRTVGIPDDQTLLSGKVHTTQYVTYTPSQTTTTATTHNGGFVILPNPNGLFFGLRMPQGNTTDLTDLTAAGTGWTQQLSAANIASLTGSGTVRARMVACGVRVVYQGTELNRAGKISAGVIPVTNPASGNTTVVGAANLSPLTTLGPGNADGSVSLATLKQSMQFFQEHRITDDSFETIWRPTGIPKYFGVVYSNWVEATTSTNGVATYESAFGCSVGRFGVPYGSSALLVLIENDTVSAAATTGNTYSVSIFAHWEVIPENPYSVAYPLTPSPFNPSALAAGVNAVGGVSASRKRRKGRTRRLPARVPMVPGPAAQMPSFPKMREQSAIGKALEDNARASMDWVVDAGARSLRKAVGSIVKGMLVGGGRGIVPPNRRIEL